MTIWTARPRPRPTASSMRRDRRAVNRARLLALTAAALGGLAMTPTQSGATSSGVSRSIAENAKTFTVRSTLNGKSELPHRIHWIGVPSLSRTKIAAVQFLIDGKVKWLEHKPPYTYSDDGGYLVTSWLAPGRHRFTVRATATDGRKATHTVIARVQAAPEPPATLAGTWQRTVDTTNAPKPGTRGNPTETPIPAGTYTLTFEKRWIHDRFPGPFSVSKSIRKGTGEGEEFDTDWTPDASTFHVQGAVTFRVFHEDTDQEGGAWCYFGGPPADYNWSVTGDTLTLNPTAGKDACGIRGFIWTGQWTRA